MKHKLFFAGLLFLFLFMFLATARAADGRIVVEDVGPDRNAPGVQQRMKIENGDIKVDEQIDEKIVAITDSDGDGVMDDKDDCPDTPSFEGMVRIGETFHLEGVTFKFMAEGVNESGRIRSRMIQARGDDGDVEVCELGESLSPTNKPACIFEGAPEMNIIIKNDGGVALDIVARPSIDEVGCSQLP